MPCVLCAPGLGPLGFTLVHVHLLTRHGDRSPMYTLPNYTPPALSCLLNTTQHPEARAFVAAMDRARAAMPKGSPLLRFSLYPQSRVCAGAQLTGQGALQHLQLGRQLHGAYVLKHRLVSQGNGSELREVLVRSTDYSRTFQSAVALVYGLLPHLNFTQLPLQLAALTTMCSTRLTGLQCKCPMAASLHGTIKREQRRRTANNSLAQAIKAEVAGLLDVPAARLPWVSAMLEVLMGHACHGLPLPCRPAPGDPATKKCFPWSLVHKMWSYSDLEGVKSPSNYAEHRRDRLNMHPLLYEIANRLLNLTRGLEKSKLVLYSGHDLTLTPLLKVLGIYDGAWPPYASRLALEVWRGADRQYFVRAVYNGRDRTSSLRFCGQDELVEGLCPLDNLVYFVRYKDIQFFGKSSYAEACAL